jgi:metallo-beta-lactamase family protein
LIPRLVKEGFSGTIYCTRPTRELAEILLLDSAQIQREDAAYKRKRHRREGRPDKRPIEPLYSERDVRQALKLIRPITYDQPVPIGTGIEARFQEAGHILGSAMLEVRVRETGRTRTVIFSGDIGQWDKPLLRDPTSFSAADFIVMESTYGDRDHNASGNIGRELSDVINQTVDRGGNVVIPTFAVERAQELMYYISELVHDNRIPDIQVFLDSPMAIDVTHVFQRFRDCFDQETWDRIIARQPPLHFPGLRFVDSVEDSKAIGMHRQPCVIMSTSGMCEAGRIKHHLRHNIERPAATVLFVGYQGRGTLGRRILDGDREVRIHGRLYEVRAEVRQIFGFSAHADRTALLKWLTAFQQPPSRVFLTHGEQQAAEHLAQRIRSDFDWEVAVPEYGEVADLD